jgi:hydroxymethylpyrimidine/phosphomethylpyrimidine kinase
MPASNQLKKLLIIAGSDSGAGAGIQGDIKTAFAHGVYASTAITALTAQNTQGVSGIFDVSANFVAEQISVVLDDIGADAIKIGMLNNAGVIAAVESVIGNLDIPIVLDTVMLAKGGAALLKNNAVNALKNKLIPLAKVVTPNLPEAEILAGMKILNLENMIEAAQGILQYGCHAVLVKGGHLWSSTIHDVVATRTKYEVFTHDKIETKNTHGTGCALATAIACHLANGVDIFTAVDYARQYVIGAIQNAPIIGKGHGPINHFIK